MDTPTAQILLAHFSYAAMAGSEADAEDASKFWVIANTFFSAAFAGTVAVAVTAAIEKWVGFQPFFFCCVWLHYSSIFGQTQLFAPEQK